MHSYILVFVSTYLSDRQLTMGHYAVHYPYRQLTMDINHHTVHQSDRQLTMGYYAVH